MTPHKQNVAHNLFCIRILSVLIWMPLQCQLRRTDIRCSSYVLSRVTAVQLMQHRPSCRLSLSPPQLRPSEHLVTGRGIHQPCWSDNKQKSDIPKITHAQHARHPLAHYAAQSSISSRVYLLALGLGFLSSSMGSLHGKDHRKDARHSRQLHPLV